MTLVLGFRRAGSGYALVLHGEQVVGRIGSLFPRQHSSQADWGPKARELAGMFIQAKAGTVRYYSFPGKSSALVQYFHQVQYRLFPSYSVTRHLASGRRRTYFLHVYKPVQLRNCPVSLTPTPTRDFSPPLQLSKLWHIHLAQGLQEDH